MTAYHKPVETVKVEPLQDRLRGQCNALGPTAAANCENIPLMYEAADLLDAKDATINYLRGQLLKEKT